MRAAMCRILYGCLLSALTIALPLRAEPVAFTTGLDTSSGVDTLYRVDLATGQATRVGPIGYVDVEGLAFHPDGGLYGVADGSADGGALTDLLIRISTTTGSGTLVAPLAGLANQGTGLGQLDYGLATTCDGRMWLASDTLGTIWQLERDSGAVTPLVTGGPRLSGLASRNNELYGIAIENDEGLYRIDLANKTTQRIGSLGLSDKVYDAGLDFSSDGRLWASLDYLTPPDGATLVLRNDTALIDTTTGLVTARLAVRGVGEGLNTVQMEGMAISPPICVQGTPPTAVPALSWQSGLLMVLGLLAAVAWLSSRR
ncbi:MAG: hypothetical protein BWZ07_01576 [Alphaproteobacteria bacterium ADurb.BinA280]|jgi:hypothetical protein|nr:hypothetical protein [Aquimonas sp.]OPZ12065.1 MAG: hypothetical protein BWZ07_01576 [Alphaproteobacteria bacterium ADurb.BinA280]